jgi:diguanylate cyclase (GGDEF)-like protein
LERRATWFALAAGAVTFVLALLATATATWSEGDLSRALVLAIVCATFSWAAARARIADTAAAIDQAIDRLSAAAAGDLTTPVPSATIAAVPPLAHAIGSLFTQLSANFDRAHHLAAFDPVTGLANRASFRSQADAMLDGMGESGNAALFFIDLDRFKAVNDSRGHASGDQLLMRVADRLRAVATQQGPAGTLVGRLAGDEFTVLCPGMADPSAVQRLGDAVIAELAQPFELADGPVAIGASVGVAIRPDHGATLHDLMRAADAAMYQSKEEGRARLSRYSDRLAAELTEREVLDQELRVAIERGEFALVFQPQVAAADRSLVAAEALLRWRHPSGELRSAGEFLKRAEVNGQMVAIGDWVTVAAARAAVEWKRAGRPGRIAVNLSQRQLEDGAFFQRLDAVFDAVDAPLDRIEFEIGEVIAMRCPDNAVGALASLRSRGARVTIDDFGAAETNLQQLRQLPIDRIKLDRTLVRDVVHDRVSREILQALVGLVHGLGCEAVAEGVETAAEAEVLRILGCDAIQGWAIAHPMDAPALARWLDGRRIGVGGR